LFSEIYSKQLKNSTKIEQKYSNLSIKASFDGFSGISLTEITLVPKCRYPL
jgi:hypothetical protein